MFLLLAACTTTRTPADVPRLDEGTRTHATGTSLEYESVIVNPLDVQTLPGTPEEVLGAVEAGYAALELVPGRGRGDEAGALRVGAEDVVLRGSFGGRRLSAYLDCGMGITGPNADVYRVSLTVWSELVPAERQTQMQTRVRAEAQSVEGANRPPIGCVSTGALEQRLAVEVNARLARALLGDSAVGSGVAPGSVQPMGASGAVAESDREATTHHDVARNDPTRGLAFEALAGIVPTVEHRRYGDNIPAYEIGAEFGPFDVVRFHGGLVLFDVSDACTRDDAAQLGCRNVIYGSELGARVHPLRRTVGRTGPYIGGRVGIVGDQDGGTFALTWSAGLEVFFSDHLAMRVEGQRRWFLQEDEIAFNAAMLGLRYHP